jgi:exodeoxyribonuclease VII large subunit
MRGGVPALFKFYFYIKGLLLSLKTFTPRLRLAGLQYDATSSFAPLGCDASKSLMTSEFLALNAVFAGEVLTVAQLNQAVGRLLENGLPPVWVRGEISNFTQAASGHWYFTLKDKQAAVRTVMFRSRAGAVGFVPRAGEQVEVRARACLYEPRGDYQLQADGMRRAGLGDLYEAFLRLKEQLAAEGLFDAQRKRIPPRLPRAIGVITSLRAAALRDVLSVLARRAPQVLVVIYPAPVQGADAALRLVQTLALANQRAEVDTLLLVRGGGSIEDLYSFNNEALARQVAASKIPVICGVGHETDFTIVDFVADVRAPTPTAAAELACPARLTLLARVRTAAQALAKAQQRRLERAAQRLDRLTAQWLLPRQRLAYRHHRLEHLRHRLVGAWRGPQQLRGARIELAVQGLNHHAPDPVRATARVQDLLRSLRRAHIRLLTMRRSHVTAWVGRLQSLNPEHTLARGYTIVRDAQGRIVRDATSLSFGQALELSFAHGVAVVQVQSARDD